MTNKSSADQSEVAGDAVLFCWSPAVRLSVLFCWSSAVRLGLTGLWFPARVRCQWIGPLGGGPLGSDLCGKHSVRRAAKFDYYTVADAALW